MASSSMLLSVPFGQPVQDVGEPAVEQQHGKAVHQRPGARDRRRLLQRQSFPCDPFLTAGGDRVRKARERGLRGFMQRRPGIVEALGAKHQPVHAGMGLGIGDIGVGARQPARGEWHIRRAGLRHRCIELPEADRGELADEPGQVAEMMGRRSVRNARLARHRAQGQPCKPVALQHPLGRLQQRVTQRAVMIGRILR